MEDLQEYLVSRNFAISHSIKITKREAKYFVVIGGISYVVRDTISYTRVIRRNAPKSSDIYV